MGLFHQLGLVQVGTSLFGLVPRVHFSITNKFHLNMGWVVRARKHETDMIGYQYVDQLLTEANT